MQWQSLWKPLLPHTMAETQRNCLQYGRSEKGLSRINVCKKLKESGFLKGPTACYGPAASAFLCSTDRPSSVPAGHSQVCSFVLRPCCPLCSPNQVPLLPQAETSTCPEVFPQWTPKAVSQLVSLRIVLLHKTCIYIFIHTHIHTYTYICVYIYASNFEFQQLLDMPLYYITQREREVYDTL